MVRALEGHLNAGGLRFALLLSRFNSLVGERLLEGALDCLLRHGAQEEDLTVVRVPGAWELPLAAARLARTRQFHAVIALGVLIRGETPHFDVIAAECAKGLAQVALEQQLPISFGVLTCDTMDQALERAGGKAGNKGWDAALAAVEMAQLWRVTE
ncbi:MAG: 6,7-dimethyl-8-ribityllumazine synthase [Thermoanaerobaculum sp.]|nr:6,7-dimethyl-8-ribityllumazine synthase [Thermoanaerobaculum sp.]MDW7968486.1 6,7-dimethyl-8-ribityllumazine synthase [Thermoanaerobaculum sp.]